ncbi:MAG: methyltransferase [Bacteroidetes bacterium]|nr:methyltransferase [Bacteroidota bacterium]
MKNLFKYIYQLLPLKKQLFSVLKFFHLPHSIYKHLYFEGILKIKFDSHSFLIRHYGFQLENEIFWKGLTNGWEKISIQLWIQLSKNADVIVDIGANTGIYSLISKTVNPSSQVLAFEPVKRVYEKLCSNCKLNSFNIECFEYAISNSDGEATIYDRPTPHVYSVAVNKNISGLPNSIPTKIKTKKLSTLIKDHGLSKIDLIKIDVETHEPEVLEGMEHFLKLYRPTLLIEILSDEIGQKVQALIKDIDYLYFNIDEINPPKLVNKIEKSSFYNYLICSPQIARNLNLIPQGH